MSNEGTVRLGFTIPAPEQFESWYVFVRLLRQLADMGYRGVDIALRDPKTIDRPLLRRVLQEAGLELPAIGTGNAYSEEGLSLTDPRPQVRDRAVERLKQDIDFAAEFRSVVLIGRMQGFPHPAPSVERAHDWIVEGLTQAARHAEHRGVQMALEPVNRSEVGFNHTIDEVLAVLNKVDSPSLGVLLDLHHMSLEETASIPDTIQQSRGRLVYFHVCDVSNGRREVPGTGELEFSDVFGALQSIGYNGYYTVEILDEPNLLEVARQSIEFLEPALRAR